MFEEPEGATPLTADERAGLKHDHIATREQLNELEAANITAGLVWLDRSRGDVLSDVFLARVHKRLFGDVWAWAGSFRQRKVNIGNVPPYEIGVQLRYLVDDTRLWVTDNVYSPLEAAARFHHRLVQIHPWPNGNGRHARITADRLLTQCFGHPSIDWEGGDELQVEGVRRDRYIEALRAADGYDFEPFLSFVGAV